MTLLVVLLVLVVGFAVGVLSALLGVGGGIVMVPFMVLALGVGQQMAEGTSLLVIIPTSLVGVASHMARDYVSFRAGGMMAIGGVVGAFLGARMAVVISPGALESIFAVVLAFAGIRLILSGLSQRRPARR